LRKQMKSKAEETDPHKEAQPVSEASPLSDVKNQVVGSEDDQVSSPNSQNDEYNEPPDQWNDRGRPRVKLSKGEWIAFFTLVAVLAQSCINYWTLDEIKKATSATQTTANAAQTQANVSLSQTNAIERSATAAETQASASTVQANVSERMAKQNEDLIKAANVQTNTSAVSAKAAQVSAQASRDSIQIAISEQRPRFKIDILKPIPFVFPANEILVIEFVVTNTGQTTALGANLSANVRHGPLPLPPSVQWVNPPEMNKADIGPGMSTRLPIVTRQWKPEEIAEFTSGRRKFVIWLRMTYDDEFGGVNNTRRWCLSYQPSVQSLAFCTREFER
jgi:hypothetical protein